MLARPVGNDAVLVNPDRAAAMAAAAAAEDGPNQTYPSPTSTLTMTTMPTTSATTLSSHMPGSGFHAMPAPHTANFVYVSTTTTPPPQASSASSPAGTRAGGNTLAEHGATTAAPTSGGAMPGWIPYSTSMDTAANATIGSTSTNSNNHCMHNTSMALASHSATTSSINISSSHVHNAMMMGGATLTDARGPFSPTFPYAERRTHAARSHLHRIAAAAQSNCSSSSMASFPATASRTTIAAILPSAACSRIVSPVIATNAGAMEKMPAPADTAACCASASLPYSSSSAKVPAATVAIVSHEHGHTNTYAADTPLQLAATPSKSGKEEAMQTEMAAATALCESDAADMHRRAETMRAPSMPRLEQANNVSATATATRVAEECIEDTVVQKSTLLSSTTGAGMGAGAGERESEELTATASATSQPWFGVPVRTTSTPVSDDERSPRGGAARMTRREEGGHAVAAGGAGGGAAG